MIYEWREYRIVPGRMPAIQTRFRDITRGFFDKHGIEVVAYWQSDIGGDTGSLYYMIRWQSLADRERIWDAFASDPDWLEAKAETEKGGPIVAGIRNMFLKPTDFSPLP